MNGWVGRNLPHVRGAVHVQGFLPHQLLDPQAGQVPVLVALLGERHLPIGHHHVRLFNACVEMGRLDGSGGKWLGLLPLKSPTHPPTLLTPSSTFPMLSPCRTKITFWARISLRPSPPPPPPPSTAVAPSVSKPRVGGWVGRCDDDLLLLLARSFLGGGVDRRVERGAAVVGAGGAGILGLAHLRPPVRF